MSLEMDFNSKSENFIDIISMDHMPDVILFEIFKKLTYADLCKCSQVCQRWYRLSQSISLRRKISIKENVSEVQLLILVHHHFHDRLEAFEFLNDHCRPQTYFPKHTFFKLKEKCPKLKKLILRCCCLLNVTLEDMPTSLRYLSVRRSEMNPYNFFSSYPQRYMPHLTCLDVGGVCNFLTSEDLYIFVHLKSLRCLFLEGCFRINNGGIESIKDILKQLEVLDVEGTDISGEGVKIIFSYGLMLKKLYLGYVHIPDDAFKNIDIGGLSRLDTLCLRRTYITSVTLNKFSKSYKKTLNILCHIDQYDNKVEVPVEHPVGHEYYGCNHYISHSCSH